ncbi:hypothetical protein L6452_06214 [Arctium lappa]|uniref:Uncharacterized protein n=1 Tax=Arctium lappa TaxID=4217 RepID=A0ACB9EIV9_ARCLA|nr:hypothetical protein L6452_06214 [Arctium lappa]
MGSTVSWSVAFFTAHGFGFASDAFVFDLLIMDLEAGMVDIVSVHGRVSILVLIMLDRVVVGVGFISIFSLVVYVPKLLKVSLGLEHPTNLLESGGSHDVSSFLAFHRQLYGFTLKVELVSG